MNDVLPYMLKKIMSEMQYKMLTLNKSHIQI